MVEDPKTPKLEAAARSIYNCGMQKQFTVPSSGEDSDEGSSDGAVTAYTEHCLFCNIREEDRVCVFKSTDCVMIRGKPVFWAPCKVCMCPYSNMNIDNAKISSRDGHGKLFKKKHGVDTFSLKACMITETALEEACKQFFMETYLSVEPDGISREFLYAKGVVPSHSRCVSQDMPHMFERDRNPLALGPLHMDSYDRQLKDRAFGVCDPKRISVTTFDVGELSRFEQSMSGQYITSVMRLALKGTHLVDTFLCNLSESYQNAIRSDVSIGFIVVRDLCRTSWAFYNKRTSHNNKELVINCGFPLNLFHIDSGYSIRVVRAHLLSVLQMNRILVYCVSKKAKECVFYGHPCGDDAPGHGSYPFLFFAQTLGLADYGSEEESDSDTRTVQVIAMIDQSVGATLIDQYPRFLRLTDMFNSNSVGVLQARGDFGDCWTFALGVETECSLMHQFDGWPTNYRYAQKRDEVLCNSNATMLERFGVKGKPMSDLRLTITCFIVCGLLFYRLVIYSKEDVKCRVTMKWIRHDDGSSLTANVTLRTNTYYYESDSDQTRIMGEILCAKEKDRCILITIPEGAILTRPKLLVPHDPTGLPYYTKGSGRMYQSRVTALEEQYNESTAATLVAEALSYYIEKPNELRGNCLANRLMCPDLSHPFIGWKNEETIEACLLILNAYFMCKPNLDEGFDVYNFPEGEGFTLTA